jgi:hypothetical protein
MSVDAVNLEDIFRQVQTNASDLHDCPPSMQLTADPNPRREGGVHTIGARRSRVVCRNARFAGAVMFSAFWCGTSPAGPDGFRWFVCPA